MNRLARPAAAILDLDGTLLDTEPLYTQATQQIAARFGKTFDWELKSRTLGGDAHFGAELVIGELSLPLSVDQYLKQREVLLTRLFGAAPAISGAEQLVTSLQARGIACAVGTSSLRHLCDIKVPPHPWVGALPVFVCGDDPEVTARKPSPDIFLVAAKRLGVSPADCVVFEDSPAGVQAAISAGMRVIVRKVPELSAESVADADLVLEHYSDTLLDELGW